MLLWNNGNKNIFSYSRIVTSLRKRTSNPELQLRLWHVGRGIRSLLHVCTQSKRSHRKCSFLYFLTKYGWTNGPKDGWTKPLIALRFRDLRKEERIQNNNSNSFHVVCLDCYFFYPRRADQKKTNKRTKTSRKTDNDTTTMTTTTKMIMIWYKATQ